MDNFVHEMPPLRRFSLLAVTRIPFSESESGAVARPLPLVFEVDMRFRGWINFLPLRFRFGASESTLDVEESDPPNISNLLCKIGDHKLHAVIIGTMASAQSRNWAK
jgi:hypothetical protein